MDVSGHSEHAFQQVNVRHTIHCALVDKLFKA